MRRFTPSLALLIVTWTLSDAHATFHLWNINEIFSNDDGRVQFIELFTTENSQQFTLNRSITTASNSNTFTFPGDTPAPTGNHHLLLATPAFESLAGGVTADFTIPTGFFDPSGDTVNFLGADSVTFSSLPSDGTSSLQYPGGSVGENSPTNYLGNSGHLESEQILGDMDCDGDVDFDDIPGFVLGLANPEEYERQQGLPATAKGNIDGDTDLDFDDIPGFVALLTGRADTAAATSVVPEPSTLLLVISGLSCLFVGRRAGRQSTHFSA